MRIPFSTLRKRFIQPTPAWGWNADGTVWVRCQCGIPMDLHGTHSVAEDGTVSPSLWHDEAECGWHVFAVLSGWPL